jgi:alkanesulfonate monooxygenase SsuD/methylene tetrahydromethanopterin reductase-like flavin-dependent oxidoreductase (luciferase family)
MAATLDHISNGRLVLGLGAGWQQNEHHAYGIPLPPPPQRLDQFEEALTVITSLLREPRTTFSGGHYTLEAAPCDPKPVQQSLPILVGSSGEKRGIPLAARLADEWNSWSTLESFRRMSGVLDASAEASGRDPASIARSTQAEVVLGPVEASPAFDPDQTLGGSVELVLDTLGRYQEAGLDEFIVPDDATLSLSERLDHLERIRTEVALRMG